MKKIIMFSVLFIVFNVVGWYVGEGLLWLSFIMKPYTPIGMVIQTWIVHIVMIFLAIIGAVTLSND